MNKILIPNSLGTALLYKYLAIAVDIMNDSFVEACIESIAGWSSTAKAALLPKPNQMLHADFLSV